MVLSRITIIFLIIFCANYLFGQSDSINNLDNDSLTIVEIEIIQGFSVKVVSNQVMITWKCAPQNNNEYYVIERSFDGIDFQEIIFINSVLNSSSSLYYSTFDDNPLIGKTAFYRLKKIGFNNDITYSNTVGIYYSGNEKLSFYPKTIKNNLWIIDLAGKFGGEILIELIDVNSNIIYTENFKIIPFKRNYFEVDISNYLSSSNVYYFNVTRNNNFYQKFFKFIN